MSFILDGASRRIGKREKKSMLKSELAIVDAEGEGHVGDRSAVRHHDVAVHIHGISLNILNVVDSISDLNEEAETVVEQTLRSLTKMIQDEGTNDRRR